MIVLFENECGLDNVRPRIREISNGEDPSWYRLLEHAWQSPFLYTISPINNSMQSAKPTKIQNNTEPRKHP